MVDLPGKSNFQESKCRFWSSAWHPQQENAQGRPSVRLQVPVSPIGGKLTLPVYPPERRKAQSQPVVGYNGRREVHWPVLYSADKHNQNVNNRRM